MHRPVEAYPVVRVRNRNVGANVTQGRMDRLGASDHEGSSGESSGDGHARRSDGRVDGECLLRRLDAAVDTAFRHGSLARERPLEGGRRVVKTHSPLCRTKPSGRGIAPATARVGRVPRPTGQPERQEVAGAPDKPEGQCESPVGQRVNRPPMSFSRSGAAISRSAGTVQRNPGETAPFARRGLLAPSASRSVSVPPPGRTAGS